MSDISAGLTNAIKLSMAAHNNINLDFDAAVLANELCANPATAGPLVMGLLSIEASLFQMLERKGDDVVDFLRGLLALVAEEPVVVDDGWEGFVTFNDGYTRYDENGREEVA